MVKSGNGLIFRIQSPTAWARLTRLTFNILQHATEEERDSYGAIFEARKEITYDRKRNDPKRVLSKIDHRNRETPKQKPPSPCR